MAKLDLPHVDLRFTIVHNTLQFLNNQAGVKRVEYPLEFKKALMRIESSVVQEAQVQTFDRDAWLLAVKDSNSAASLFCSTIRKP